MKSFLRNVCGALAVLATSSTLAAEVDIEKWLIQQEWFRKLEESLPEGTSLSLQSDGGQGSLWREFLIREHHRSGSGFDDNTSPAVGLFRVLKDRSLTQWFDPAAGDWTSVAQFLESRAKDSSSVTGADADAAGNKLLADLDRDGKTETVRWTFFREIDGNRFYRLEVLDDDGSVLWTGPDDPSVENAYVFFEAHEGISMPQLLRDVDADGRVELLGPEPQSDVSATYFRSLHWTGSSFSRGVSRPLMLDDESLRYFEWKDGDHSFGIWVSRFTGQEKDGAVHAEVTRLTREGKFGSGTVLLRFHRNGAVIERWTRPLGDPSSRK